MTVSVSEVDLDEYERMLQAARKSGQIRDMHWRLNNLYIVKDIVTGRPRTFKMTEDHEKIYRDMYVDGETSRLIVIKSRQVFMTTYSILQMMDNCMHQRHVKCLVSNWSEDEAKLTVQEKAHYIARNTPWVDRAGPELTNHGVYFPRTESEILVSVTGRGQKSDNTLITEFAKTSSLYPDKAEEVMDGMLSGSEYARIIIESTGKGTTGIFPDMVRRAYEDWKAGNPLNRLKWKLRFIAWWNKALNRLPLDHSAVPPDIDAYLDAAELEIEQALDRDQRNWYANWLENSCNGDWRRMKQEYPTTLGEALAADLSAYVIREYVEHMYATERVGDFPYRQNEPVVCFWDFGFSDSTVCLFVQKSEDSGYYEIIDAIKSSQNRLDYYFSQVEEKHYNVAWHVLPWDAEATNSHVKQLLVPEKSDSIKGHFVRSGKRNIKVLPKLGNKRAGFEATRGVLNQVRVHKDLGWLMDDLKNVKKLYRPQTSHYEDKLATGKDENHAYDTVELLARAIIRHPELWSTSFQQVYPFGRDRQAALARKMIAL